jgi:hypothetical protein
MFRAALLLTAFAACATGAEVKAPCVEVAVDKADKLDIKPGKFTAPSEITTADELAKFVEDEPTRTRLGKLVDFKTQKLVIFSWQGSGQDSVDVRVMESFPEQLVFTLKPGGTRDLRTHLKIYAVRNDVKYSVK